MCKCVSSCGGKDALAARTCNYVLVTRRATHVFLLWGTVHRVVPSPLASCQRNSSRAWLCSWTTDQHNNYSLLVDNNIRRFYLKNKPQR